MEVVHGVSFVIVLAMLNAAQHAREAAKRVRWLVDGHRLARVITPVGRSITSVNVTGHAVLVIATWSAHPTCYNHCYPRSPRGVWGSVCLSVRLSVCLSLSIAPIDWFVYTRSAISVTQSSKMIWIRIQIWTQHYQLFQNWERRYAALPSRWRAMLSESYDSNGSRVPRDPLLRRTRGIALVWISHLWHTLHQMNGRKNPQIITITRIHFTTVCCAYNKNNVECWLLIRHNA